MILEKLYFRFRGVSFPHVLQNGRCIFAEKDFAKLMIRERARVDRGGKGFSVVIFSLENRERYSDSYRVLIKRISGRIRVTDEVGWIDRKSIGVLLVEVMARDALKLASEILGAVRTASPAIRYRVESYPSGIFTTTGSGSGRSGRSSEKVSPVHADVDGSMYDNRFKRRKKMFNKASNKVDPLLVPPLPPWKRAIDLIGSAGGILVFFPFGIVIALIIKTVSPGPVFYKQKRLGFMGKPFMLWKFRTMQVQADCEGHKEYVCDLINNGRPMEKLDSTNSQIIPFIGKALRNSCIDEIPQLINVLRGEMSLVGPRPCIPYEFEQYLPWHKRRVLSVPGLTGLWQVNGKNKTTFRKMIGFDIIYGRKMSLWLDLEILIKTIWVIFDQTFNQVFVRKGENHGSEI